MLCGDEPVLGAGCVAMVGVGAGACDVVGPAEDEILESNEPLRWIDPPPHPARILVSGCSFSP
jgi:hypothetical protein